MRWRWAEIQINHALGTPGPVTQSTQFDANVHSLQLLLSCNLFQLNRFLGAFQTSDLLSCISSIVSELRISLTDP